MSAKATDQVITISSTVGLVCGEFISAYAASKFALEGWAESLRPEIAPYGISTMTVEPGTFRTELLVEGSSRRTWAQSRARSMPTVSCPALCRIPKSGTTRGHLPRIRY
jgi:short-subunit dehydrogenase